MSKPTKEDMIAICIESLKEKASTMEQKRKEIERQIEVLEKEWADHNAKEHALQSALQELCRDRDVLKGLRKGHEHVQEPMKGPFPEPKMVPSKVAMPPCQKPSEARPSCPQCGKTDPVKRGTKTLKGKKTQVWNCKGCGSQYTKHTKYNSLRGPITRARPHTVIGNVRIPTQYIKAVRSMILGDNYIPLEDIRKMLQDKFTLSKSTSNMYTGKILQHIKEKQSTYERIGRRGDEMVRIKTLKPSLNAEEYAEIARKEARAQRELRQGKVR